MTEVIPFRGLLYNPSKVPLGDVIAPPYDIITPEKQEELYNRSNHNIARIDYGKIFPDDDDENNRYTRASEYLKKWINEGIMALTEKPAYYIYEAIYHVGSVRKVMRGVFGAVRLVELGNGVYPHEETHSKPKEDRLNLMHACQGNTSPIFSLYNHPGGETSGVIRDVVQQTPHLEIKDDEGILHRCWVVDRKDYTSTIRKDLSDIEIIIADGHHRYETALEFQRQISSTYAVKTAGMDFHYVLMLLVSISDGGFTILPTHRLVRDIPDNPLDLLQPYFTIEHRKNDLNITEAISSYQNTFGLCLSEKEGFFVLKYKGGDLSDRPAIIRNIDVMVLHDLIFKKLYNLRDFDYEMDVKKALNRLKEKEYQLVFFLKATKVEDVEKVARMGFRMPPKSTYFYPKIPTGLVINYFQKL